MKSLKKKVLSLFISMFLLSSFSIQAFAATTNVAESDITTSKIVPMYVPIEDQGSAWYAPKGGTWTKNYTYNSPTMVYNKIVYIPYAQVALIAADNWASGDLNVLACIIRDRGVSAALSYIASKVGQARAQQYIPYIGNAIVAYDVFTALMDWATAQRYKQALDNGYGIIESTGYTLSGGYAIPFSSIDLWTSTYVYNPTNHVGSFTGNY